MRASNVPFRDITWCANQTCPKRFSCGRSGERLKYLPFGCAWWAAFQPEEDGTCKQEEPYANYIKALMYEDLKQTKENLTASIDIIRKKYDEDGSLDEVQNLLEEAEAIVSKFIKAMERDENDKK